ncbi:actin cytoskeleton and mitosis protein, variant 3 [Exophiala dermatitidis]|nr:actin cytoskeleton and mitosis protein, variant 3 [Exophiala dermatitidis]KAJ4566180.1 actin cytoskeleton and mitosis protein, variant 3 [Exophiala dermatitidis]KAJ4615749.1 actin cytoskeleton and mitosis protein, variant 3 [Exophiala dermatitidis]KAJ4690248.1 actin cytoskeleton and mitosis protein, variant 3 [Exophiala dermatitidis]KAJ9000068.1 actin cytoskeleton and mitosis protein, variant 3 [Exophiala dermatitidis]
MQVHDDSTGRDMPSEERMVKRFRRSAAGYDEQLPSDIRTPATLQKTLDYLLDRVIGGEERLATIHKFVWDRTRGIRNDFSIQQVTNTEDVKIAVDCYERIARFHILSLHQLSNPDNLLEGENFDAHQEREQLNNTLLSLLYYYDDNRDRVDLPNEGEFRAYCIIFELQSQHPDLEDRIQAWPKTLLADKRVQTALKLYMAAGNGLFDQGPLRPTEPFAIAQSKVGTFWQVLSSRAVPYMMACVAEIYFAPIRFAALDALWRSCKSAPSAQQARSRDWTLAEVTNFLGFDTEAETKDFCAAFDIYFGTDEHGEEYLDVTSNSAHSLDQSSIPNRQSFSHTYVEKKRYHRTLTAVINGVPVAEAIRQGLVEPDDEESPGLELDEAVGEDDQSMFVPETKPTPPTLKPSPSGPALNPEASTFTPKFGESQGSSSSVFGRPAEKSTSSFGQPTSFGSSGFGSSGLSTGFGSASTASMFGKPAVGQPQPGSFSFGGFGQTPKEPASNSPNLAAPSTSQTQAPALSSNPVTTPTFTGFNFGHAATASSTAAPAPSAVASTSSAIPPIFGPRATFPPSGPAEEPKTKTPAATTPVKFTDLTPQTMQTPSISEPKVQTLDNQPKIGTSPAPIFSFQPQVSQDNSKPPAMATTTQSTPSVLPSTAPSAFKSTTPSATTPTTPFFVNKPPSTSEAQKPSSGAFKFPSVQASSIKAPEQAQPDTIPAETAKAAAKPFTQPTSSTASPQVSTTPPHSPTPLPAEASVSEVDRDQLVTNLAKVALLRKNGMMQHYIEYALPDLLRTALNQHRLEVHDTAVASIRSRILARKFGYIWRTRAWRNSLNRKAKNRRQLFAQTIRAEEERKKRNEEELEEILRATQETKRLQQEVEQAAETRRAKFSVRADNNPGKVAGQKRKSFSGQEQPQPNLASPRNGTASGTPVNKGHKRSRTLGTFSEPSNRTLRHTLPPGVSFRASRSKPPPHVSIFSPRSTFGRSVSGDQNLRESMSGQKVDTTHTDYFKLKAMGIDPETPIIPDTEATLALRKRREEEERKAALARASRRTTRLSSSSLQGSPSAGTASPSAFNPPVASPAAPTRAPTAQQQQQVNHATPSPVVEDDFLKQIREAREALAEQAQWFKEQTVTLEREMEQEEQEFRKSSHSSSRHAFESSVLSIPPATTSVGKGGALSRAQTGYEYRPSETKPGVSLSRTEQRIRMTGAHGLATSALGPKPRTTSSSGYIPVAMSKRSAMTYKRGAERAGQDPSLRSYRDLSTPGMSQNRHGRKRSHDDVDADTEIIDPSLAEERRQNHRGGFVASEVDEASLRHAAKRPRGADDGAEPLNAGGHPSQGYGRRNETLQSDRSRQNPYDLLQEGHDEDEDEDQGSEEDEDGLSTQGQYRPGRDQALQSSSYPYPGRNNDKHTAREEVEEEASEAEEDVEEAEIEYEEEYEYEYDEQEVEEEDDEDDELLEEDEDTDNGGGHHHHLQHQHQHQRIYAHQGYSNASTSGEGDGELYEDEEDEEDEDGDGDAGSTTDSTTPLTNPAQGFSRATTSSAGPGGSADDAVVLSDSD